MRLLSLLLQLEVFLAQQVVSAATSPSNFTFTFTSAITKSGPVIFDVPDGTGTYQQVTMTGPTTYVATLTAGSPERTTIYPMAGPKTFTVTSTLEIGSQVLKVPAGDKFANTTITGPTTWIATFTANWNIPEKIQAGIDAEDPHCSQTAEYTQAGHSLTYARYITTLTERQTETILMTEGIMTGGILGAQTYINSTFTGPTSVYETRTTLLAPPINVNGMNISPGDVCGGRCGFCQLFFSTVYVYYWPVATPNTACLSTSYVASSQYNLSSTGIPVQPRGLSDFSEGASTLVHPDGFTFTSPSVYIAFPTISAFDYCGILGSVHTSVTLGFPPGALSTVVFNEKGENFYPFDFADAHCPPASLSGTNYLSIVGQTGYNPVISPPAGLTLIDPAWNANCRAADFQGNDPPFALTPASNLTPFPTSVDSVPMVESAIPSPSIIAVPVETARPSTPTAIPTSPIAVDPPSKPPSSSPIVVDPPSKPPSSPPIVVDSPSKPPSSFPIVIDPPSKPTSSLTLPNNAASVTSQPAPVTPQSAPAIQSPSVSSGNPQPKAVVPGESPNPSLQSLSNNPQPSVLAPADPIASSHSIAALPLTTNAASILQVGSQTLQPDGPAVIYSGTTYSLVPSVSSVIVNGIPVQLPAGGTSKPAIITLGGQSFTANSASNFIIESQTLTPGGLITAAGATISLAPSASFLVIGSDTQTLKSGPTAAPAALTLGGQTITANSASNFIIGSQTLVPGSAITILGTPISLATSGSYLVAGTSTITLVPATGLPAPEAITFGGQIYTADTASNFVIGGQTLKPGSAITISGTPISLATSGSYLVAGTSTIPLIPATGLPAPKAFTFGGQTYTANSASDFVIAGQTLKPGSAITISGTPISLATTPTDVVVGSSTQGLASLIMDGFGSGGSGSSSGSSGGGAVSSSSSITPFEGAAARVRTACGVLGEFGKTVGVGFLGAWLGKVLAGGDVL